MSSAFKTPVKPNNEAHHSANAKHKISTLHSYHDMDADGYLNFNEMCGLEHLTAGVSLSVYQYTNICQALHCNPVRGIDLRGLSSLYWDRISVLYSYCDANGDGFLSFKEMCLVWQIIEGEDKLLSPLMYKGFCHALNCDPGVGIDLVSLRKILPDDPYRLDNDFEKISNPSTCSKLKHVCSSKTPLSPTNVAHHDSSSLVPCVPFSAIEAASDSATCTSLNTPQSQSVQNARTSIDRSSLFTQAPSSVILAASTSATCHSTNRRRNHSSVAIARRDYILTQLGMDNLHRTRRVVASRVKQAFGNMRRADRSFTA